MGISGELVALVSQTWMVRPAIHERRRSDALTEQRCGVAWARI
jgi:hypothetical protein